MDDDVERRLTEIDRTIERVAGRLANGYGSESDRAGWFRWLDQLRSSRAGLLARRTAAPSTPRAGDTDVRS